VDKLIIATLQSRVKLLDEYWEKFTTHHENFIAFFSELKEDPYFTDDVYLEIESIYSEHKGVSLDEISTLKANLLDLSVLPHETSSPRPTPSYESSSLPRIPVPKFSGRQEDWENWKKLICSIVKKDEHLPPVEKLQYLLNSVEGEAARELAGTKIIASNQTIAWNKLTRRYDNDRIRSSKHFDSIINLEAVKRRSASELNRVLDTANEAIQGFRDLSYPVQYWDRFLLHLVVQKIDKDTRED